MDLTEAKRLLSVRDECANDRIDIRSAIQRNLANQVPGLVAEVERLRARPDLLPALKSCVYQVREYGCFCLGKSTCAKCMGEAAIIKAESAKS